MAERTAVKSLTDRRGRGDIKDKQTKATAHIPEPAEDMCRENSLVTRQDYRLERFCGLTMFFPSGV